MTRFNNTLLYFNATSVTFLPDTRQNFAPSKIYPPHLHEDYDIQTRKEAYPLDSKLRHNRPNELLCHSELQGHTSISSLRLPARNITGPKSWSFVQPDRSALALDS